MKNKKGKLTKRRAMMPPPALDEIFRAMRRRRVFQSFGFKLPPKAQDPDGKLKFDRKTDAPTRRDETIVWDWVARLHDWIDMETGDCLSGYEPGAGFRAFVDGVAPAAGA